MVGDYGSRVAKIQYSFDRRELTAYDALINMIGETLLFIEALRIIKRTPSPP